MFPNTSGLTFLEGAPNILDLYETHQDDFTPGDLPILEAMLCQTARERGRQEGLYSDTCQGLDQLTTTLPELDSMIAAAKQDFQQGFLAAGDEIIATGSACDVRGIAARLRPVEDQLTLLQGAKDLLFYRRIPAARLRMLEALLRLRKLEALEASLMADLSHARTLEKLTGAFLEEGRCAFVGQRTTDLRNLSQEAKRRVGLAETALRDEKNRQATLEQTRMACGTVTRAEVCSATPVHEE